MLFLSVFMLSVIVVPDIRAQILHTPPLWDANVNYTHIDRVNAANAALSQVVNMLNSWGDIANDRNVANTLYFYEALANYNIITRQHNLSAITTRYRQFSWYVTDTAPSDSAYLREITQRGYTAARTFLSSRDDVLLDRAKQCWDIMNTYTISESDLQSGRTFVKNFSLPQSCTSANNGKYSLGGAAFQNVLLQSPVVDVYETAYFFLFSSIMAKLETPPNSTYVAAARASLDFVMQQPFVPHLRINQTIALGECGNISVIWPGGTSTVGFVIAGLSILAVLEDDEDLHKLLLETIQKTFDVMTTGWPNPIGILSNYHNQTTSLPGPEGLPDVVAWDIEFVRGLAVAYRNASSLPPDIRDAIKTFLGVQYNAVRNLAFIGNNLYDGSWRGPSSRTYSPSFDVVNQSFAAQVLIDGIDIFDELPPPTRVVPVATLAGSIAGGVLFLVISIALAAFFYRRRQLAAADSNTSHPASLFFSSPAIFVGHNMEVTPFEWDPEWNRDRPNQNTKKRLLSVNQNANREPVADQAAAAPVVGTPPVDDYSDSPPEYRSQLNYP